MSNTWIYYVSRVVCGIGICPLTPIVIWLAVDTVRAGIAVVRRDPAALDTRHWLKLAAIIIVWALIGYLVHISINFGV